MANELSCSLESANNNNVQPTIFPLKLHQLLDNMEENGQTNIISWMNEGKAFKIHDTEKFTNEVMPLFFGSNKIKSFQRNLNLWGFTTGKGPVRRGISFHKYFLRGKPELCSSMKRIKIKGNGKPRRKGGASSAEEQMSCSSNSSTVIVKGKEESRMATIAIVAGNHLVTTRRPGFQAPFPANGTRSTLVGGSSAIVQALRNKKTEKPELDGHFQDQAFPAAPSTRLPVTPSSLSLILGSLINAQATYTTPTSTSYMLNAGFTKESRLADMLLCPVTAGMGSSMYQDDYLLLREYARNEATTELLLKSTVSLLSRTPIQR